MPKRDCFSLVASAPRMSADGEEAEVMLYGEIVQDYGKFYKEFYPNDKCAADFDAAIKEVKKSGAKRLRLRINSPGGIVTQAVAMRGILTGAGFDEINIRIEGMCASAATIIATIPGVHVSITPGSEYMIHNPWTFAWGNAADMEHEAEHLRALEKTARGFYAAKTGKEDEQIRNWMDAETWFTAEEAVANGFADELAQETSAEEAAACVSAEVMAAMKDMYSHIPECVHITQIVSTEPKAVAAEGATENNENAQGGKNMNIKDITQEELSAQNPELCNALMQSAIQAERQRMQDIDDLTLDGEEYRRMAADAKKNGTSAADFQKQIVQYQRNQKAAFLKNRQNETAPAANVSGGAAEDEDEKKTEEAEMKAYQAEMKEIFANVHAKNETMM